jgi:hypothetical protein
LAINEISALVGSPLVNFNSSTACSLVNPLFVKCFIVSSGKGDGVTAVVVADGADRCWWWLSAEKKTIIFL